MATTIADFPIYKDEDRHTHLAYYFERLARWLLHMELMLPDEWAQKKSLDHFDLDVDSLRAFIEVKGCSNNDALKLFRDQLEGWLGSLGFPVEDGFVWIFIYRNRANKEIEGIRPRLLKEKSGKSWNSLSKFLSKNTSEAIVIDVKLLAMLCERYGTRAYTRDKFRDRETVRVTRTILKRLAQNARTSLAELGFAPEEIARWLPPGAHAIRPRTIDTVFDDKKVQFTLIPLLPNGAKRRFLRQMNGNVKK